MRAARDHAQHGNAHGEKVASARVIVHLFDGTYELFRAWFGAPHARHADREVGAVRSMVRSFAFLLRSGTVTHAGAAFDHVIESFRNDLFDGYKTGEGLDPDLVAQFELAERATAALGLVAWPMIEFEADDAIATAAARADADPRVDQVRVVSPDKDLCQCVRAGRVVVWDRWQDVVLDEAAVIAKHGVPPASIPDLLALVGDTADGIPGIAGWGKSSAQKLLAAYGRVEAIPDDAAAWTVAEVGTDGTPTGRLRPIGVRGAERLAASLRASRRELALYKTLATLRADCPIACDVDALAWRGPDRDALGALCVELGVEPDAVRLTS
jgi:5'-3' exonuclease